MPEDLLRTVVLPVALRILLALLVWVAGRWLARRSRGWLNESLQKTVLTESFITLITTVSYFGILILAGFLALAALGVPVTALATALGIVVVVLAIALLIGEENAACRITEAGQRDLVSHVDQPPFPLFGPRCLGGCRGCGEWG